MMRNKVVTKIQPMMILIIVVIGLSNIFYAEGPAATQRDYTYRGTNAPILLQVGKDGKAIPGYTNTVSEFPSTHMILSFSYGVQASAGRTGVSSAGRPQFLEIAVVRKSDAATPKFHQYILKSTVVDQVTLRSYATDGDGKVVVAWDISLQKVTFTSLSIMGSDNSKSDDPYAGQNIESITFVYQMITISNTNPADGSVSSSCWDVVNNIEC